MPINRFPSLEKYKVSQGSGDKMTLSMVRPKSATNKVMQRCPSKSCQPAIFQIGNAPKERNIIDNDKQLVRRVPGSTGTTCPYCGTDGDDPDFVAQEDIEHIHKEIMHSVTSDVSNMLDDMAKDFNRRNHSGRNSMLSISMKHKPSHNPRPFAYREDLLRGISCHVCAREYGVYALALFCPDCGSPNVSTHFDREIDIINQQIEISMLIDGDENKEVAYRLLSNAHEDALTALETTLKAVYRYLVLNKFSEKTGDLNKVGNAFQNLDKVKQKFEEINIPILDEFDEHEIDALTKAIQKRHVIGHNLGLADEKYTRIASDAEVGKNVPVLADEIKTFTGLCAKLIHSIEKELGYGS